MSLKNYIQLSLVLSVFRRKMYRSILLFLLTTLTIQPLTIMIDPIGDAGHTGREIEDTFERGVTAQCAQKLKEEITRLMPDIHVVLTRMPGETLQPLQNASFANRLDVDFYLSLAFYGQPTIPAHVAIFYYLEQETDRWHKYNALQFYHVSQAHLINLGLTQQIAQTFLHHLQQKNLNSSFAVQGVFAIPCRPLMGIKAPALCIEAGLRSKDDWKNLINPLISCIQAIIPCLPRLTHE